MANEKKKGSFAKLFGGGGSCCCNLRVEEVSDADAHETKSLRNPASRPNPTTLV